MSLPNILKTSLAVLAGWTLLRLSGRVMRLEAMHPDAWRVQHPAPAIHEETARMIAAIERELRDAA